jgi:ketosteroid isomerase-like protein
MHEDVEIVMGIIRAVEERDRETLLALCHDDVEFHDAESLPYGGVMRGKERIESRPEETWIGTWGPLQPTAAERRMDPRIVSAEAGEVVVAYHLRAVSPGGERIDHPVLALYEVRDARFARAQMFHYDTVALAGFLERAGITRGRTDEEACQCR